MEQSLDQIIKQAQTGQCLTHKEESIIFICLNKDCSGYLNILCNECMENNHPEHSSKYFKSIKKFFMEVVDSSKNQEKNQENQTDEEQKEQLQRQELIDKLNQSLKEIQIISNKCIDFSENVKNKIYKLKNPDQLKEIVKGYIRNNQNNLCGQEFKEEFLEKIKNSIQVNQDLKIGFQDEMKNINFFMNLAQEIQQQSIVLNDSIEYLKSKLKQQQIINFNELEQFFQISDLNHSLKDVTKEKNKFYFSNNLSPEQIHSQALEIFPQQQVEIQLKITGSKGFQIGLIDKEDVKKASHICVCSNQEKFTKNMYSEKELDFSEFIKNKKQINLVVRIELHSQKFEVYDQDKSIFYFYKGNQITQNMCFYYLKSDIPQQMLEIVNIKYE